MTESNNGGGLVPLNVSSAAFDIMKTLNENQQQFLGVPNHPDSGEPGDLKNCFLAAAISVLGAAGNHHHNNHHQPLPWEPNVDRPKNLSSNVPNKAESFETWADRSTWACGNNQAFPNDFPFPNPFLLFPHNMAGLDGSKNPGGSLMSSGTKDEDFCELCQKHFCNKYYLRKHKNDVHRISSEAFSQVRKRDGIPEVGGEEDSMSADKTAEWMNILKASVSTAQQLDQPAVSISQKMPLTFPANDGGNSKNLDDASSPRATSAMKSEVPRIPMGDFGETKSFMLPVSVCEPPQGSMQTAICSSSSTPKPFNFGAMDMFKSSMAAAKLADRVTCDLCKKELCNKYFLRTHKIKVHGLSPREVGGPTPRSSAVRHHYSTPLDKTFPSETPKINFDPFCVGFPPLSFAAPNFGLLPPMSPSSSQIPAPLGSLPPWLPPANMEFSAPSAPAPMSIGQPEELRKDPVMQLMATNTLVTCPLCDKTIGPRLFLPTHLTSVHGLSPTDPSFFIFILSARALENDSGKVTSNTSTTASSSSDAGSPSGIRTISTAITQDSGNPFRSPNTLNGLVSPLITGVTTSAGGVADFAPGALATVQAPAPMLLPPPPLGLLPSPSGLYAQPPPPPHSIPSQPTIVNTTQWNPIPLEVSEMVAKCPPSAPAGAAVPRKSPNQMRVLCNICNKWICNKYFLRTHRANKHGITDPSPVVGNSGTFKGAGSVVPLDYSKYTEKNSLPEKSNILSSPTTITSLSSNWMFQNPAPRSNCFPHGYSTTSYENAGDRGCPLNLSTKRPPQPPMMQSSSQIKHGVDQFLSNTPRRNPQLQWKPKLSRRIFKQRARLRKAAGCLLAKSRKLLTIDLTPPKSHLIKAKSLNAQCDLSPSQSSTSSPVKPWHNLCQTCNVWFNKRSQLEAHLYVTGHQRLAKPSEEKTCNASSCLGVDNQSNTTECTLTFVPNSNNCSPVETRFSWMGSQNRWIDFNSSHHSTNKKVSVPTANTSVSTADVDPFQCSYQVSHVIHHSVFSEPSATAAPSI